MTFIEKITPNDFETKDEFLMRCIRAKTLMGISYNIASDYCIFEWKKAKCY